MRAEECSVRRLVCFRHAEAKRREERVPTHGQERRGKKHAKRLGSPAVGILREPEEAWVELSKFVCAMIKSTRHVGQFVSTRMHELGCQSPILPRDHSPY